MAQAVFLRAANVGGHNVFRPKDFADEHPELQLTNIGHAGTFVSRRDDPGMLGAFMAALPVEVPVAVVDQAQIQALVAEAPPVRAGAKLEVTVRLGTPTAPVAAGWAEADGLRVLTDHGWCIVTERVPGGKGDPFKALAKAAGAAGTTRSWGIMEKIAKCR